MNKFKILRELFEIETNCKLFCKNGTWYTIVDNKVIKVDYDSLLDLLVKMVPGVKGSYIRTSVNGFTKVKE